MTLNQTRQTQKTDHASTRVRRAIANKK